MTRFPDTRFARDLEAMIRSDEIEKSIRVTEQRSSSLQQIVIRGAAIFAPILSPFGSCQKQGFEL
jgi:hypothetical protein